MVATTRPSGVASTAASSPTPTTVLPPRGSWAVTAAMSPNSPRSPTVTAPPAVACGAARPPAASQRPGNRTAGLARPRIRG
jgi:hypothetical protein